MKKHNPVPLAVERLEDRAVPATFGVPWLDGSNLTLSFAPDGTATFDGASNLSQTLTPLGLNAAKLEILRAFQTWASQANVNIGVAADGGQAFGSNGAIQGDQRFGDIRLFAQSLGSNQLAETSPFNILGGTNAGDITLNSDGSFSIGGQSGTFDLYSLVLQEAGHTLGIGNSDDPNSAMYEVYGGVRTGLTSGDISELQGLYGARIPDRYEGLLGNDSPLLATLIGSTADAELTTRQDVDCYRFIATSSNATVQLQVSGHSLMTGRVTVLNASGQIVATATAADPLHNDITLNLSGLRLLNTYVIRVDSPRGDEFDIGSYRLNYQASGLTGFLVSTTVGLLTGTSGPLNTSTLQNFGDDRGSNDSIQKSTPVTQQVLLAGPRYDANFRAVTSSSTDVDFYRITAPALDVLNNSGQMQMLVTVFGLNGSGIDPRLKVYDQNQKPVAARVLTNNDGSFTVQVDRVLANQSYFLRISGDSGSTGEYEAAVNFRTETVLMDTATSGTLSAAASQSAPLYLTCKDQLFHFALSANSTAGNEFVQMNIYDANQCLVFTLNAAAGDTVSDDVFLAEGVYTIGFTAVASKGVLASPIDYSLGVAGLTDPVVSSTQPTTAPSGGSASSGASSGSTTTSSSGSPYTTSSSPPPSDPGWY